MCIHVHVVVYSGICMPSDIPMQNDSLPPPLCTSEKRKIKIKQEIRGMTKSDDMLVYCAQIRQDGQLTP